MKFRYVILILSVALLSCSKYKKIDNKYLEVQIPTDYKDITNPRDLNDILYLCKIEDTKEGKLQSIFAVDNILQNLLFHDNSEYIKNSEPIKALESRLKSIEESCNNPDFGWKNFKIIKKPEKLIFKEFKAASAEFEVTETIEPNEVVKKKIFVKKRIRRYVIFLKNDLWNIVMAPSNVNNHEKEIKIFEKILESMNIK